jgi:anti-sigma factor RsiW
MTTTFTCDDKATLIAYLYAEVDAATRQRVDAHLETCARCAAEVTALADVRAELAMWAPPDAELGFAVVRKSEQQPAPVLRPAQWWRTVPAWAQAAAAMLVLAAGLGIANLQVRSGPEGFSVTTGWMAPAPAPALSEPFDGAAVEQRVERALVSLEQQLRNEIRAARDQQPATVRASSPATADEATIRRVQQLLAASEARQAGELALRMTQFAADMNLQRRADLQLIRQGFGQYDEQMLRQRQMMNNVIRASATGQQ